MKAFAEVYIYTRILGYLNAKYLLHRQLYRVENSARKKKIIKNLSQNDLNFQKGASRSPLEPQFFNCSSVNISDFLIFVTSGAYRSVYICIL